MANFSLNRLISKFNFGSDDVKGSNYQSLMSKILAYNSNKIATATAKLSKDHWDNSLKKVIRTSKEARQFIIPDISEVIPKDNILFKKSAERGQLITDTLHENLIKNLRDTIEAFKTETGEQAFLRRRGKLAGTMNPKLTANLETAIFDTFQNYTKVDPRFGVPTNIHTIAVTEARSTINEVKETYNRQLMEKNKDLEMMKEWLQNRGLSREPRIGHSHMNHVKIKFNEKFQVPLYQKVKGGFKKIGVTAMSRPHDPSAPLEQIVGCHCECKYYAVLTN